MTTTTTQTLSRFANLRAIVAPVAIAAIALSACGSDPADADAKRMDRLAERVAILESEVEAVAEAPERDDAARDHRDEEPGAVTPEVIRPRADVVIPKKLEEARPQATATPRKATRPQKAAQPRKVEELPPSQLKVIDSTMAIDVIKRTPLGAGDTFSTDDEVLWAWVRVRNDGEHTRAIKMVWKHDGEVKSNVTLDVGVSKGWRTWSKKSITERDAGLWTVEVFSPEGEVLDTMKFEVESADSDELALNELTAEGCAH
ncbi:MAG: hypothetical protein CMH57_11235 [Myxococcales bacterium]|nr:hypothetical protein [Myxococcales bacterium]